MTGDQNVLVVHDHSLAPNRLGRERGTGDRGSARRPGRSWLVESPW